MKDDPVPAARSAGRSHIAAGARITGELSFPGTVELPGHVKGRVEAAAIVVEESGEVDGEIHAASILIKGRVSGQIVGGTVSLRASARVTGDITYDSLSIETAAEIEGQCRPRTARDDATPVAQGG